MSTYAIGDVQGCYDALQRLLETIHYDPEQDTLWFAGDLINRGLQSLETLRFIKSLPHTHCVLGNHDFHLLALAHTDIPYHGKHTLTEILDAEDRDELLAWVRQLPLLHHDEHLGFTMVHAGLVPQWDLSLAQQCAHEVETLLQSDAMPELLQHIYGDQPDCWHADLTGWERIRFITNVFTRIRFCDPQGRINLREKGPPGSQPDGLIPWFEHPDRQSKDVKIIFGHWASLRAHTPQKNVFAVDGGSVWGGQLIALRLDDEQRFSDH